jgi:formylglycine-generating enzyme required for sulfatase activity
MDNSLILKFTIIFFKLESFMKSKIFISILIFVGIMFGITSCQDLNNPKQLNLNINLDLSNLTENQSSQELVLKVLVYNASTYKNGSKIENLPLFAETESKLDENGDVKVSLEVQIGLKIILVAKLYQVMDGKVSESPLYAGNSEVIKIKASDNKVHINLKKQQNDTNNSTENGNHKHTFPEEWSSDGTYHWKWSTCNCDMIGEKSEHNFGEMKVTKQATCEQKGEQKTTCTICAYEKTEKIENLQHNYVSGFCETCGTGEMVLIETGSFKMGSNYGDDDSPHKPVQDVTITRPFYIGKYEVTQPEYEKYCIWRVQYPSEAKGWGDLKPAYHVSWYDTLVYCNKRSIAEGLTPCYSISGNTDPNAWGKVPTTSNKTWNDVECDWTANGYRLPTEAEWEYAARAENSDVTSLTFSGDGYYGFNPNTAVKDVGEKKGNNWGLYDMSGNVEEWCWNWYTSGYDTETEGGENPTGAQSGTSRVTRGGSVERNRELCTVYYRLSRNPSLDSYSVGFRVVRSAVAE